MAAGTRTFGISESLIEPPALPPPPTRHALLVFLIALAAILHVGTAGWSDIHNGAEGFYSGSARAVLHSPAPRDFTVLQWLIVASYKVFGLAPASARFPVALAMVASVALTFLIGERFGGYWRGFTAGLIHLCGVGSFIWARIVTPAPIFAALLEATIFCAVCGYQRQQTRRAWFAAAWGCAGLACTAHGIAGLLYPLLILLLLALFFREARIRFRRFFQWPGMLLFLALVVPWSILFRPGLTSHPADWPGVLLSTFLFAHLAWWFPILFLVLPGVCVAWRKVFRPEEFDFRDALPLCWIAVGLIPALLNPLRQDYDSIPMWGGFALAAAAAWDRMPRAWRLAGIGCASLTSMATACYIALNHSGILPSGMLLALAFAFACAAVAAGYFTWRDRETLSLAILLLAMVPVGLGAAEAMARLGRHFSLATAAQSFQPKLGESGEVIYEGSFFAGSSLSFYLDRPFSLVGGNNLTAEAALEKMGAPHPVYLIANKDRVSYWQERLTERFHIYHQESSCGPHLVISNQP